jgi:tetratricopeptide (TPR) repeat protein
MNGAGRLGGRKGTVPCAARCGAWLAPLLTLALGCATLKLPDPPQLTNTQLQQRKQEAVRQFEQQRDQAEFQSAQASWDRGDAKTCEDSLRRLLTRNPKHRDGRLLLVEVELADKRTAEACKEIQHALEDHPQDAQVQYAMGLTLDACQRRGEALAYYERAAKAEPDNELYAVGYHTALAAAHKSSDAPEPLPAPGPGNSPGAVPLRGAVAGAAGGASADRAEIAEAGRREAAEPLLQKGEAALREGSPEAALACFREAASPQPNNPQILISAATIALRYNQPDLAVELLQPAEKRFAGSASLKRILGAAYYRLGDYRSSQVALQQALSLDKSSALTYFLMGCTLLKLDKREQAETCLRQAQTLDPRYTAPR